MREILFRAKAINRIKGRAYKNGDWMYGLVTGMYDDRFPNLPATMRNTDGVSNIDVDHKSIGQYTGLTDKNGKKIFEGDIVQYSTYDYFVCKSIVKFGEYKQDGSSGEHDSVDCLGFYVEVGKFTCPDWFCNEPENFQDYLRQQNLAEIASQCEIIGNIHDSPELLEA